MSDWVSIDGSTGEGGGQILRSSLALAMLTGRPLRLERIRARRKKPGLMNQHLTAVQAAAQLCQAEVQGNHLHSQQLVFVPGKVQPGDYYFDIGTAGSAALVLQTVLPPLLVASGTSHLKIRGGTHNPLAPTFDFLAEAFAPLVNQLGPHLSLELLRPGFFPRGGGLMTASITPTTSTTPTATGGGSASDTPPRLNLEERGKLLSCRGRVLLAGLPRHIALREIEQAAAQLQWATEAFEIEELPPGFGPGNCLSLAVESERLTELFFGIGQKGVPAEEVARRAAKEVQQYLARPVAVGPYLADQLLLPLAICGGGTFCTEPVTPHFSTNVDVLRQFLEISVEIVEQGPDACLVHIG